MQQLRFDKMIKVSLLFLASLAPTTLAWVRQGLGYKRFRPLQAIFQPVDFLHTFSGDFDNYDQVLRDRRNGLLPREGGGHEHIHCTLIPVSNFTRLAAFYFDGNPQKIFRFRFYEIDRDGKMKLFSLVPPLETLLRKELNPMKWPLIFLEFGSSTESKLSELYNCDVQWSVVPDPHQHAYALDAYPNRQGNHAIMVYGEAVVESTMLPGTKILVRDQLSLWDDEFWIHDRGYDPESMSFIYGNHRGIPYQLQRVTRIQDGERIVCNGDLKWTLGSDWRTSDMYNDKMRAIHDLSSRCNS